MMQYENLVSQTVRDIKPSGIRKFFDIVDTMEGVITLTIGQPDFLTPWHIRQVGIETLESGKTFYTSNSGLVALREEICTYLARRFDLQYDKNEVLVTVGGSEAIDLAIRAIINPGDEVIIPAPSFVCYEPLVKMAGGVPVIVNCRMEDNFKLTPELLRSAITDKTKMLVMPFPNNPTGAIMTKEDLLPIAEILRDTNIFVLSDEIYGELTYGRSHVSVASLDGMKERTVIVSGFSKSYAMTGWRLGYLCAPEPLAKLMLKVHQYGIMCAPTTSQYAAIEALKNGDNDIAQMKAEYDKRRKFIYNGLKNIGIECFVPEGAFYIYPYIGNFGMSCDEFCERLLYEEGVAIVPGTAFGECGEGFARISYAYSLKHIATALEKIEGFVKKLK